MCSPPSSPSLSSSVFSCSMAACTNTLSVAALRRGEWVCACLPSPRPSSRSSSWGQKQVSTLARVLSSLPGSNSQHATYRTHRALQDLDRPRGNACTHALTQREYEQHMLCVCVCFVHVYVCVCFVHVYVCVCALPWGLHNCRLDRCHS